MLLETVGSSPSANALTDAVSGRGAVQFTVSGWLVVGAVERGSKGRMGDHGTVRMTVNVCYSCAASHTIAVVVGSMVCYCMPCAV